MRAQRLSLHPRYAITLCLLAALLLAPARISADEDLVVLGRRLEQAWNAADWPSALALLDHMRTLAPSSELLVDRQLRGHLNYAWDLLAAGLCSQAGVQFERALSLLPGQQEASQGLALVQARCPSSAPPQAPTLIVLPGDNTRVLPAPLPTVTPHPREGAVEYTVRRGDTLFSLARRYGVSVAALQRANGLRGEAIQAGARLVIPPSDPGTGQHTVQAGETLYALARRYGTTVDAIQRANGLTGFTLRTGQVLVIPEGEGVSGQVHTVLPGETLYRIAGRYGISVAALQQANGLRSHAIRAGQALQIPASAGQAPEGTHRVQPGDTLYSLARRYGTSVEALQSANGLSGAEITVGTLLAIP